MQMGPSAVASSVGTLTTLNADGSGVAGKCMAEGGVEDRSSLSPGEVQSCCSGHSHIVDASDLPTKSVVVFVDRAEVKRAVQAHLPKGTNEIVIQNVSNVIERQSVRVDGDGVLIQEVQYLETPLDAVTETDKVRALETEQNALERRRTELDDNMASLRKRIHVLDGVAAQIAAGPATMSPPSGSAAPLGTSARRASLAAPAEDAASTPSPAAAAGFLMSDDALNNLVKFLNFYGETAASLKAQLRDCAQEAESLSERIESLERQIGQLRCGYEYDSVKRSISITIELDAEKDVELFVTYQVYCASWKPMYDIRASTAAESEQSSSITLCYYGMVEQNTGDSWKDVEMVLSTATPSVAGCAPPLGTLAASLHRPSQRHRHASAAARNRRTQLSAASEEDMGFGSFDYAADMADAAALHRLSQLQPAAAAPGVSSDENSVSSPARSLENISGACAFSIARPVTVPSNGTEHKVLVAQVQLDAAFFHETVPSKSAVAFLSAMVTNTSQLPLLPAHASIYLNSSFVSKTYIHSVPPGEEFRCTLGPDPSVKVEYKTPQRAQDQVGFVSKSTLLTYEQTVSLRNAKVTTSVRVTVREQIPKAVDDKIKVTLVSPEVKKGADGSARLNRDHNLEWTVVLAPGQQKDLAIRYTVEHPVNETVAYRNVVHP